VKKRLVALVCFLSVLLLCIFLTTYTSNDHKNELIQFANQYVDGTDLTSSVYKDSYENEQERFTLYENNGGYFIVWSQKHIWSLGRYKVEGGSIPFSSTVKSELSEFHKVDAYGSVYIIYGNYKQRHVTLKVENGDGSASLKNYEVNGDHTFIVYQSKDDHIFTPILDGQNY
jgi:hypothetical protein